MSTGLKDNACPMCGRPIARSHRCRGRVEPITPEQRAQNIQACYDAINDSCPTVIVEPLPLIAVEAGDGS